MRPGYFVRESGAGREENVRWGSATVRAAVMLVASFLLFAYLPDRLLTYLAIRTTPTVRDLLVSISWVVTLVLAFWLFVRLQRTGKA